MNKPKSWQISRRTVLRGIGASIALPWLDVMASASHGSSLKPPLRMAYLFMPNGVNEKMWQPQTLGPDYTLSPTLEPLKNLKADLLVLDHLRNKNSLAGEGHYVKTTALLTGAPVRKTGGKDLHNGISVDQLAAAKFGQQTPLASMELGIDPIRTQVDMGYSTVYGGNISWRSADIPAIKEIYPRQAFDRLFRSKQLGKGKHDQSILDVVLQDAKRLKTKVSANDRQKLNEYYNAVRSLEKRIHRVGASSNRKYRPLTAPRNLHRPESGIPKDYHQHVKVMLDLMIMAFWTDTTRISTFMFANSVSGRNFSFLEGVNGGFHPISHHKNDAKKLKQYHLINRYHVEQVAYFCQKLKDIKERGSNLLDNAMVMFASGIRDGNKHDPNNVPLVLLGKAGGKLKTGNHIRFEKHTPLCNLYATLLNCIDPKIKSFGDSSRMLKEIQA